jgi:transcriptional regulator with XRE-family HTH domain
MTLSAVNQARLARIKARRAEGWTYRQIGDELGISQERVRQLVTRSQPKPEPSPIRYPLHPLVDAILDVTNPRRHHP